MPKAPRNRESVKINIARQTWDHRDPSDHSTLGNSFSVEPFLQQSSSDIGSVLGKEHQTGDRYVCRLLHTLQQRDSCPGSVLVVIAMNILILFVIYVVTSDRQHHDIPCVQRL